jgi:hypothetical protein
MEHKIKKLLDNYQIDPPSNAWGRLETKLMAGNKDNQKKVLPLKSGLFVKNFPKIAAILVLALVSLYSLKQFTSKKVDDLSAIDYNYYSSNIRNIKVQESKDDIFEVKNLRLLKEAYNKH